MMFVPVLVALLLVASATSAGAQTIYRCGNEYTRVPCLGGKAVDAQSTTTAAQRAEAARIAARERHLADDMVRDRERQEARQRPKAAQSLSPKPASSPASASLKPKKKSRGKIRVVGGDDFVAKTPKAPAPPR